MEWPRKIGDPQLNVVHPHLTIHHVNQPNFFLFFREVKNFAYFRTCTGFQVNSKWMQCASLTVIFIIKHYTREGISKAARSEFSFP